MSLELNDFSAKALLEKFGEGKHKPGSGSAVAYQAMISAQLIHTVISLTKDPEKPERRARYINIIPTLERKDNEIQNVIMHELEVLFKKDSFQFDKVIKTRETRDNEKDPIEKSKLIIQALEELKPATEYLIDIAKLCNQLADISAYVFDNGFKAARGDSAVALKNSISCISGCLAIIDLNLISFSSDEWTDKIRYETNQLRTDYTNLYEKAELSLSKLQDESIRKDLCDKEINQLLSSIETNDYYEDSYIEDKALKLQNIILRYSDVILKKTTTSSLEALRPDKVFTKALGYQLHAMDDDEYAETAGIIDQEDKVVYISNRFSLGEQNFTAAHELGHALFHRKAVYHRDRLFNNSAKRSPVEFQADKFAAYFLMPTLEVQQAFFQRFSTYRFIIDENTALQLGDKAMKNKYKSTKDLCRYLAQVDKYGITYFNSMAKEFNVSIGAMAMRLEELGLVVV